MYSQKLQTINSTCEAKIKRLNIAFANVVTQLYRNMTQENGTLNINKQLRKRFVSLKQQRSIKLGMSARRSSFSFRKKPFHLSVTFSRGLILLYHISTSNLSSFYQWRARISDWG